ncbi:MAG TPA: hypothetical protein VKJ00_04875 [Thermoanaerobaculia bacterium]|nr:hypothetical protein [Thermoanaerobaculia bacterium]
MNVLNLVIGLIGGAVGGNAAGAAMKNASLGTWGNSLAGIVGGGLASALLPELGISGASSGADLGTLLANVASGGVGGAILMAIVGLLKTTFATKA